MDSRKGILPMTSLQIGYFLTAARQMSFTKAAAELYITQPSLSKQITNLESELGVELFDRSVRTKLRLTPAGATLRDFFTRSTEEFNQVLQAAQDENGTLSGTLGNEFVKMISVSFLNSNIYPLKNLLTSRVCISLETPYSKASSHFPIASHLQ